MESQESQVDELKERLASFTTLFQLDIPRVSRRHHEMNVSKLEREQRDDPGEFYQNANAENLLAFLLLRYFNDLESAKRHIDSVLEKQDDNVVALGNLCGYYLHIEDFSEAEKTLDWIEELLNTPGDGKGAKRKALALAEQAYSLSRLGPKCHLLGIEKSREALCLKDDCLEKVHVEVNYALALILDRCLDTHNYIEDNSFDPIAYYTEARQCLDVVTDSRQPEFCGKGFALLGDIYKKMNRIPEKYFVAGEKLSFSYKKIDGCFEQAKREAPDDHFVLERVGRHYRLCRSFEKAIACLQKANKLCPMPFPCHHLGLVYMAMAENNIKEGGEDTKTKELLTEAGKWLEEADRLGKKAAYRITADLARVYVKLNEYQKALCCFKRAAEENTATDDGISLVAAGNYENWGKCFLLLGKTEEGKTELLKAVECAARVKFHRRTAFSELVNLMQMEDHDRREVKIDKLNELAKLHELVSRHREALNLRKTACELDPSNPNTLLGLIEHCCKRKTFALAQMYLSFLQNLTDITPPKELFLQVKLNAVAATEPSLAYKIFQEIFKFIFPQECLSDIFIFSADEDKEIACSITCQFEKYFGLTCLCLHRDLHSMMKISETVEALNDSVLILFVVSECLTKTMRGTYFIERAIECVNSRGCGNIISLTTAANGITIPKLLQDFPTFNYEDVSPTTENMGLPLFNALIENAGHGTN